MLVRGHGAVYCRMTIMFFAQNFWNFQNVLKLIKGNAQNMTFAVSTIFHRNDTPGPPWGLWPKYDQYSYSCNSWWWVGVHSLMRISHKCLNWQTKIAQIARLWFNLILFILATPASPGGVYGPKAKYYTKYWIFAGYVWGWHHSEIPL